MFQDTQRKILSLICCTVAVLTNISNTLPVGAAGLRMPKSLPAPRKLAPAQYTPDILLVMPGAKMASDEFKDILEDVHGTLLGSIGEGEMKCCVIKTEKGHLEDTEKKLKKDKKHFNMVGKNYFIKACSAPSDPYFTQDWHLQQLHCPKAWDYATGSGVTVAVLDTGCESNNPDLKGKVAKGYDAHTVASNILGAAGGLFGPIAGAIPGVTETAGAIAGAASGGADHDKNGHGTMVATTLAGSWNNGFNGCGVAPNAKIYPIRIAEEDYGVLNKDAKTTDLDLIAAMIHVMSTGIRVINISYAAPGVGFANPLLHPQLHYYFNKFWIERSGLIFMAAGNTAVPDPSPRVPYLVVVSAVNNKLELAEHMGGGGGSTYGPFVTFTAPGTGIGCSNQNMTSSSDGFLTADGTSLSSPMCAGIAALILDKQPMLPNFEVLRTMARSCVNVSGGAFNPLYGFGMPDAGMCAAIAAGASDQDARNAARGK